MSNYCVNPFTKGQQKTSIGNLNDALAHYRSKVGGTLPANESLFNEMKNDSTFIKNFGPKGHVVKRIKAKIADALKNGEKSISNEIGSRKEMSCRTLGSYSVSIEYNHPVTKGINTVSIRLYGTDCWDFQPSEANNWFGNLTQEIIPGIIAGKGKPFDITYDFTISVDIVV